MDEAIATKASDNDVAATPAAARRAARKLVPAIEHVAYEIIAFNRVSRASIADGAGAEAAAAATDDTAEEANEPARYHVVLSTDAPISRSGGCVLLTFSHKKSAIDMSYAKNGLSLLLEHGASNADQLIFNIVDPGLHIGILDNITLVNEQRLEADMQFSSSPLAQQIEDDVADGTRRYLSIANIVLRKKLTKAASSPDEPDEYLATRWMPVEGSIVSIPANPNARVANSTAGQEFPVELESDTPEGEGEQMNPNENAAAAGGTGSAAPAATLERQSLGGGAGSAVLSLEQALEQRNQQISEIVKMCRQHGMEAKSEDWIRQGLTPEAVGMKILEAKAASGALKGVAAEVREGLSEKDRKRYSISRTLELLCRRRETGMPFDGVEGEVDKFISKRANDAGIAGHGGIFVPNNLSGDDRKDLGLGGTLERQTMQSQVAQKGAEFVFDHPGEMIEFLRNASVCQVMGAQMLSDLVGDIPFPKQQGDVTVTFVGENPASPVAASDVATGLVTLKAKTMQGAAKFSRQLIRLSSVPFDNMVNRSFGFAHALAFDRQGLHGSGAGGQCVGIYNAPDVGAVACGSAAPTWQVVLNHISAVATANAHLGALGFVTTVAEACRLKNALKASAASSAFIWEGRVDSGSIDGYRAMASNQASSTLGAGANEHAFVFGNWSDMLFGTWGGLEIIVDPLTLADSGLVRFISFQMGDLILRHGQSFAKGTAATLT